MQQFETVGSISAVSPFQLSSGGEHLFCKCSSKVNVLEVKTGKVAARIGQDEDDLITSFVVSPDSLVSLSRYTHSTSNLVTGRSSCDTHMQVKVCEDRRSFRSVVSL